MTHLPSKLLFLILFLLLISPLRPQLYGGNNAPSLELRKIRFEQSSDAPAILVLDEGQLRVRDCIFDRNPAAAIRMISGDADVAYTTFSSNGHGAARGGALQVRSA